MTATELIEHLEQREKEIQGILALWKVEALPWPPSSYLINKWLDVFAFSVLIKTVRKVARRHHREPMCEAHFFAYFSTSTETYQQHFIRNGPPLSAPPDHTAP
jgi:hypothetical protein